ILDMTSTYWLFILPFLNWFISYKGYKIDKSIVKEIQSYKGSDASAVVIIATGFAVTMTFILRPIFNELTLHTSYGFNLTLLILSMLITILIRILRHYRLKSKMKQHFSIESMPITLLKVREFKAIYHLTYVIRYIIFWGVVIFTSVTFVTLGGVILLICATAFLHIALIMNFQSIRDGKAEVVLMDNKASSTYCKEK